MNRPTKKLGDDKRRSLNDQFPCAFHPPGTPDFRKLFQEVQLLAQGSVYSQRSRRTIQRDMNYSRQAFQAMARVSRFSGRAGSSGG